MQLIKELADVPEDKPVPGTLLDAIETFNQTVTSGYDPDHFRMFGGKRPEKMPAVLDFTPLPKIEVIEVKR